MSRVIHFEFSADNPEKSVLFYQSVFGWNIKKWDESVDYWLVSTGDEDTPGINGAIKHRITKDQPTVVTIDVHSIDEILSRITKEGGTVLMEKIAIPGIGFSAYAKDPEGNIFGIMEREETDF